MPKLRIHEETRPNKDEQALTTIPGEPVETSSNSDPAADANGDSDDEREDENLAGPEPQ
jgi:hypothetical protein